jgi:LmbE family N-acetylglucosaminyl deacetylase
MGPRVCMHQLDLQLSSLVVPTSTASNGHTCTMICNSFGCSLSIAIDHLWVTRSVREFIASEALAALGIPTTRALSLVTTGAEVLRDMFYK